MTMRKSGICLKKKRKKVLMDLSKMKSAVYEMKNYAQLGSWQFRPFRRQDR